ncbi:MAG: hypothetical protein ACLT8E_03205 [Akkermansia sp.]
MIASAVAVRTPYASVSPISEAVTKALADSMVANAVPGIAVGVAAQTLTILCKG